MGKTLNVTLAMFISTKILFASEAKADRPLRRQESAAPQRLYRTENEKSEKNQSATQIALAPGQIAFLTRWQFQLLSDLDQSEYLFNISRAISRLDDDYDHSFNYPSFGSRNRSMRELYALFNSVFPTARADSEIKCPEKDRTVNETDAQYDERACKHDNSPDVKADRSPGLACGIGMLKSYRGPSGACKPVNSLCVGDESGFHAMNDLTDCGRGGEELKCENSNYSACPPWVSGLQIKRGKRIPFCLAPGHRGGISNECRQIGIRNRNRGNSAGVLSPTEYLLQLDKKSPEAYQRILKTWSRNVEEQCGTGRIPTDKKKNAARKANCSFCMATRREIRTANARAIAELRGTFGSNILLDNRMFCSIDPKALETLKKDKFARAYVMKHCPPPPPAPPKPAHRGLTNAVEYANICRKMRFI